MNVVVFGPQMEDRALPAWAMKPITPESRTPLEIAVHETAIQIGGGAVTIIGPPWVNPRGRSRASASIRDYLDDPLTLMRALTVAFTALRAQCTADAAIVAVDAELEKELAEARTWVTARIRGVPIGSIVWTPVGVEGTYHATLEICLAPLFGRPAS